MAISVGSTSLTGTSTLWATSNSYSENNARTTGKVLGGHHDIYPITTVDQRHRHYIDQQICRAVPP